MKFCFGYSLRLATHQTIASSAFLEFLFCREEPLKPSRRKKRQDNSLPIAKMTERFSRNTNVSADEDVSKRVFYLAEDQIKIEFHYAPNRITNSSRIFHKDGHSQIVQVDPLAKKLQPMFLLDEFQELLLAEKECVQVRNLRFRTDGMA